MTIKCPQCGELEKRTELRIPFHLSFSFCMLGLLGGCVGGLFWALGQKKKFQCAQCQYIFFSHTSLSRVFAVLCIFTYLIIVVAFAYGLWTAIKSPR